MHLTNWLSFTSGITRAARRSPKRRGHGHGTPGPQRVVRAERAELLENRLLLSAQSTEFNFLNTDEVQAAADAAADIWEASGLTTEQLNALETIEYQIADLGEHNLGQYRPGVITVDDNAAGHLWFVDETPTLSEEFHDAGGVLTAVDTSLAYGKMDLLTVLLHEQGHALGLGGELNSADGVMAETLGAGVRRLPTSGEADGAVPGSLETVQYLTSATTGGGQSFSTVGPYATVNYAIALVGTFPSRSISSEPMIGTVDMFAGNFAPRGWALAHGQILQISQNSALFSILGTTYGGDGRVTFALPDLRGRVPVGAGNGPGLSGYALGEKGGSDTATLTVNTLPSHTHTVTGSADTEPVGNGRPVDLRQPYLALTPIIATTGLFPSRSLSSEGMLGAMGWFAGNFAPRGYAEAAGQLLDISQNSALFSILGTTYGGDGRTTFGLPDLRGRMAVHQGNGPGLAPVGLGQRGGTESFTLTTANLPSHSHGIPSTSNSTGHTGGGQSFDIVSPFLGVNYVVALLGALPIPKPGYG